MLRQLDWLHDLDISYDASTFDTDPFEPQPDGAKTIFPFIVSSGEGHSYVELPYTLVQDSTLFLTLKATSNEIWERKLDWIGRKGGLALLNVHPDYVSFDQNMNSHVFPSELYAKFLRHVKREYTDRYWSPLPRELADFTVAHQSAPSLNVGEG